MPSRARSVSPVAHLAGAGPAMGRSQHHPLLEGPHPPSPRAPRSRSPCPARAEVVYQYFAAVVGQAVVLPLCWGFAWAGRDRGAPWWFGAQPQCAAGEYLAFSVAYFLSDALANWADTSGVLLLHHAAAVACALLASVAGCWLGLFVSLAMVYEVGSLSWSLSDLGLFPRHAALWTMLVSTLLPMVWVLQGLLASPPRSPAGAFNALVACVAGALRLREVWAAWPRYSAGA
ncbi:unnamed protein product, partial [Prorocentrum cordatum]